MHKIRDFHEGQHCRRMSGERHGMCESAFSRSLVWGVAQRRLIFTDVSVRPVGSFKGQAVQKETSRVRQASLLGLLDR
jgi:hypothetical protein